MRRHLVKLETKIQTWVSQGLISEQQADKILAHEGSRSSSSWFMVGLLSLGAFTIGLGVISLIAANWREIPDAIKLGADFLVLSMIAYGVLWAFDAKKKAVFEGALLLFIIGCMATIGLLAQIFHSNGTIEQALLFWSLITFPAVLAANAILVPMIWSVIFASATFPLIERSPLFEKMFHGSALSLLCALVFVFAIMALNFRRFSPEAASTRAFSLSSVICGVVFVAIIDGGTSNFGRLKLSLESGLVPFILAQTFLLQVYSGSIYRRSQKFLLTALTLVILLGIGMPETLNSMHRGKVAYLYANVITASLSIVSLGLAGVFCASIGRRPMFQAIFFLVGLRFLALYFQALGGLALTGLGLIVSGLVVVGFGFLWNKYRLPVTNWAEGMVK